MKRKWWLSGLALALVVVLFAPLASPHPDGLERVAEDLGFGESAQDAPFAIIPDYVLPGVENEALATILAGAVGTVVMFALVYGLGRWAARRRASA